MHFVSCQTSGHYLFLWPATWAWAWLSNSILARAWFVLSRCLRRSQARECILFNQSLLKRKKKWEPKSFLVWITLCCYELYCRKKNTHTPYCFPQSFVEQHRRKTHLMAQLSPRVLIRQSIHSNGFGETKASTTRVALWFEFSFPLLFAVWHCLSVQRYTLFTSAWKEFLQLFILAPVYRVATKHAIKLRACELFSVRLFACGKIFSPGRPHSVPSLRRWSCKTSIMLIASLLQTVRFLNSFAPVQTMALELLCRFAFVCSLNLQIQSVSSASPH